MWNTVRLVMPKSWEGQFTLKYKADDIFHNHAMYIRPSDAHIHFCEGDPKQFPPLRAFPDSDGVDATRSIINFCGASGQPDGPRRLAGPIALVRNACFATKFQIKKKEQLIETNQEIEVDSLVAKSEKIVRSGSACLEKIQLKDPTTIAPLPQCDP